MGLRYAAALLLSPSSGRADFYAVRAEEPLRRRLRRRSGQALSEVEMASRSTLYTLEILRLAGSLPEPVELERVDGSAELRSPTCGSNVQTEVQLDDGRVEALSQQVQACAFGQASAALVARQAAGRSREEIADVVDQLSAWLSGESEQLPEWPGIEALTPARSRSSRHGAILLPFRALLAAIDGGR